MSLRLKRIDYFVFFFKQKTAYEMRISDWSSDVCSSDLSQQAPVPGCERVIVYFEGQVVIRETLQEGREVIFGEAPETLEEDAPDTGDAGEGEGEGEPSGGEDEEPVGSLTDQVSALLVEANELFAQADEALPDFAEYDRLAGEARDRIAEAEKLLRSEEHTSELQSLMRITYDVFCLKKKTNNSKEQHHNK